MCVTLRAGSRLLARRVAVQISRRCARRAVLRYGDDPTESPYFPGDKTVTALVADMKHGVRMPVTVETDGKLGILSDGNHRVAAAKIAGIEALPTRFVRVKSRYVQRGGGAPLPDSIQKHLKKHPNAVRAAVPRQPSWQQGER